MEGTKNVDFFVCHQIEQNIHILVYKYTYQSFLFIY